MPRTNHAEADPSTGFLSTVGNRLRQTKLIAPLVGALALAGCAETVAPLEPTNVSVRGVELPADLAQVRTEVLELCNTGEGASDVKKAWIDYGFEETTGMKWIDAFTFSADFGNFEDPNDVLNYGSTRYPTIQAVAEDCLDAARLVSTGVDTIVLDDATATLEEMHALDYDPTEEIVSQIARNIDDAKEAGIL